METDENLAFNRGNDAKSEFISPNASSSGKEDRARQRLERANVPKAGHATELEKGEQSLKLYKTFRL